MDLVSVIIPTYNSEKYINRSLKSVLEQSYKELQVIIVDDGSTDSTQEIVKTFNDSRVEYVKFEKNKGANYARNKGIELAKGKYITFLDADDEWLPTKVECQLDYSQKLGDCFFLFSNAEYFFIDGTSRYDWDKSISSCSFDYSNFATTAPSNWFFSKKAIDKIGLFDVEFNNFQDIDYIAQAFKASVPAYYLDSVLAKRYEVEGHLSSFSEKKFNAKMLFLNKHMDILQEDPDYLYKFYYAIAKDALNQNKKSIAQEYYKKAIKIKPLKFKAYYKLFKTLFLRSET